MVRAALTLSQGPGPGRPSSPCGMLPAPACCHASMPPDLSEPATMFRHANVGQSARSGRKAASGAVTCGASCLGDCLHDSRAGQEATRNSRRRQAAVAGAAAMAGRRCEVRVRVGSTPTPSPTPARPRAQARR